ncbi:hypothetical protein TNCV_674481 [Trichonephila clavipes]|nr:hypothetical protein TNCV_674481 [Trichonephila clavipes]
MSWTWSSTADQWVRATTEVLASLKKRYKRKLLISLLSANDNDQREKSDHEGNEFVEYDDAENVNLLVLLKGCAEADENDVEQWLQIYEHWWNSDIGYWNSLQLIGYSRLNVFQCPKMMSLEKNPEGSELAKNGHQNDRQVTKLVAKNDANLALSPRFRQVPIESPL